ncbi:hypothetical protein D8M04_03130 [Oceanobacillus piezotolerans]|uniref:SAM-dependent methyltransferase n=1 Tax=Oceanobacillus piezotolerans TaxID=2448030 RepID=A0A498DBA1_9BACI|nr:class I SAM-dependent methyltransferase [Oceanobacillus piezotolerans]RLL48281.1 hypothetical protein D8M04_03130 [Oceanobacillus piezotolerans]
MIVTTSGRSTGHLVTRAKKIADKYDLFYKERNGVSVETMKIMFQDDIVVVGKDRLYISPQNQSEPLFFHPSLAIIRAKRILKGEHDPFITSSQLRKGKSVLDCTLGLGADSIIASLIVGTCGSVTALEGNPLLFLLTTEGLATFLSGNKEIDQAIRSVETVHTDYYSYLKQADSDSFDIVYFDPMFRTTVHTSTSMQQIREQAIKSDLTTEILKEAKRVAKERVILKDHWKSERFRELGFKQLKRKNSVFHYGIIELGD